MSIGAAAGGGIAPLQEILKARALKQFQDQQLQQQQIENDRAQQQIQMQQAAQAFNENDRLQQRATENAGIRVAGMTPNQEVSPTDAQAIQSTPYGSRLESHATLPSRGLPEAGGAAGSDPGGRAFTTLRPDATQQHTIDLRSLRSRLATDPTMPAVIQRLTRLEDAGISGVTPGELATPDEQAAADQRGIRIAGAKAGAEAKAKQPFERPPQGPQPQLFQGADGKLRAVQFVNGQAREIPLPGDVIGKPPTGSGPKLNASQQDNLAGLNTAEVEGVKVLRSLKTSGLDQSNDPTDPRWNQFVVQTLKVAPEDYNKADIQQRSAFVKAALTRGLMGGRPSQYVAEMIQQHMPDGAMSGVQLSHVLRNVLDQSSERRKETAGLSGVPYQSLKPSSGEDYESFLTSERGASAPSGDTSHPPLQKYGGVYNWDGSKYVRQP